jgi:hypothetical protein
MGNSLVTATYCDLNPMAMQVVQGKWPPPVSYTVIVARLTQHALAKASQQESNHRTKQEKETALKKFLTCSLRNTSAAWH